MSFVFPAAMSATMTLSVKAVMMSRVPLQNPWLVILGFFAQIKLLIQLFFHLNSFV
jgi:hypothetical protein